MPYYYPVTITEVRTVLKKDPSALCSTMTQHLQEMCDTIDAFDPFTAADAFKAARYVGWILAQVESGGHWTNDISRDYVRADVLHGRDMPLVMATR